MTEPRWTVEEARGEDPPFRLAYRARQAVTGTPWCDDLIVRRPTPVSGQAYLGPEGFDALVAAVRDADLLRQARDFIALKLSDAWLDDEDVHDLLDLLSSPVADSREGTG